MAKTLTDTAWKNATPLRLAWRDYADLGCEGFMLFKRYEVLRWAALDGPASDVPPNVYQEFEPKDSRQRANLADHRERCLHIKLLNHLADGELIAFAKQLTPTVENEARELPAGLFGDRVGVLDISWEFNQLTIGSQRFGDLRVAVPTKPAARGKPQMHLDLAAAAQIILMSDPKFLSLPPKVAFEKVLGVIRASPQFRTSRAKTAKLKTFYPVFAALKRPS